MGNPSAYAIPSWLRQRLREEFYASVRHNLLLTHELHRVLHTLKGQGIPALAYKGPIWAAGLHGNLSARSFCDLDILVNKADVLKAKDLLAGQGYVPEHALGRLQEWWKLLFDCEYQFDNTGSGVHLEVHWRIVPGYVRFRLEMLDVWQSSGTVVLSGQEVPTLSRQDALSVLCIHHGGKHLWSHLQGLVDLDRLVGAPGPFDWTDFLRRATGQGLLRILCVGFELARRLLDTPVPEEVNSILQRDETGKRIAARIFGTMMEQGPEPFSGLTRLVVYWNLRERLADRLRYLPMVIYDVLRPTDKERSLVTLRGPLGFLYVLIRPVRLLAKYAPVLLRRVPSRPGTRRYGF